jgi:hypothetical protein
MSDIYISHADDPWSIGRHNRRKELYTTRASLHKSGRLLPRHTRGSRAEGIRTLPLRILCVGSGFLIIMNVFFAAALHAGTTAPTRRILTY